MPPTTWPLPVAWDDAGTLRLIVTLAAVVSKRRFAFMFSENDCKIMGYMLNKSSLYLRAIIYELSPISVNCAE